MAESKGQIIFTFIFINSKMTRKNVPFSSHVANLFFRNNHIRLNNAHYDKKSISLFDFF